MPSHPTVLHAPLFLAALLIVLATSIDGLGCAVAPPKGVRVDIAQESAILLWDPANKTQHFIRRASFSRGAGVRDFGFIVPTPSYPKLAEANDEAFKILERATAPKTVNKTRPINLMPFGCAMTERAAPKAAGIEVLQDLRIAGYDAVVLEAKDTDALGTWLNKHGYDFPDSMKAWADGYLRQGWKFTAFKVGQDAKGQQLQLTTSLAANDLPADN